MSRPCGRAGGFFRTPWTPLGYGPASSNISRTPWAGDLKLSGNLNKSIFKKRYLFFNSLRPPSVTIATFKVDSCFWKAHFGSFHIKAYQNSMSIAISMNNVLNVVCCEKLWLIVRLTASWWRFSFRTPFCASTTLNLAILSPWSQEWSHSIWFLLAFRKLLLLTFNKGCSAFHIWTGFPSQNLKAMNHLKAGPPWRYFCHLWS